MIDLEMIELPSYEGSKKMVMGFKIYLEDAMSPNFKPDKMKKCETRYKRLVKKPTIQKTVMEEYRKYCKKNGFKVTNMTTFFRKKGMLEEKLGRCDRCKRDGFIAKYLVQDGKEKVCPYCDGRMVVKETDLMRRAKGRALAMANQVGKNE